jgi:hypothetical protein
MRKHINQEKYCIFHLGTANEDYACIQWLYMRDHIIFILTGKKT